MKAILVLYYLKSGCALLKSRGILGTFISRWFCLLFWNEIVFL